MDDVIKPPPEFYRFARLFGLDRPEDTNEPSKWIATVIQRFDPASRQALKQFLTNLLQQNVNESELQKLWKSSGSSYYIVGKDGHDGVKTFLTMVRDQIA